MRLERTVWEANKMGWENSFGHGSSIVLSGGVGGQKKCIIRNNLFATLMGEKELIDEHSTWCVSIHPFYIIKGLTSFPH